MTRDMLKILLGVAIVAVLIVPGSVAWAEEITYQQGDDDPFTGSEYAGAEDNFIVSLSTNAAVGNRNYGVYQSVYAGSSGTTDVLSRRNLLRFDITSLNGEFATIDSVTLRLHVGSTYMDPDHDNALRLYRLTSSNGSWVEGTSSGSAQTDSSCWNYRAYDGTSPTSWASNTAGTTWSDYEGGLESSYIASASVDHDDLQSYYDLTFTDVSFISTWAAGTNSGLLLRAQSEADRSRMQFHSSNSTTQSGELRPELIIEYTAVPEPSTIALLGIGALMMLVWCRRRAG